MEGKVEETKLQKVVELDIGRKTSEKVGNRSLGWIVLWEKHSESSTVTLSPIKFNKKHKKVWNLKLLNIAEHHYSLWEVPIYSTKSYITV